MADSLSSHNETSSSVKDCQRDYQRSSDPRPLNYIFHNKQ